MPDFFTNPIEINVSHDIDTQIDAEFNRHVRGRMHDEHEALQVQLIIKQSIMWDISKLQASPFRIDVRKTNVFVKKLLGHTVLIPVYLMKR